MKIEDILDKAVLVGSQAVEGAATEDSDTDYLYFCSNLEDESKVLMTLVEAGYVTEGSEEYSLHESEFKSFRKDSTNILLCFDGNFYNKFVLATELCNRLKLKDREGRIIVHEALLYNGISGDSA